MKKTVSFTLLFIIFAFALRAEASSVLLLGADSNHPAAASPIAQEDEFLTGAGKKNALLASDAHNVIEGYLGALKEHDIPKSYYAFTSNDFRKSTPWESYRQFIFNNPVLLQNKNSEFKEPIFQDKIIIFKGNLTSLTGQVSSVEIALVTEGDQWKIFGIKIFSAKK